MMVMIIASCDKNEVIIDPPKPNTKGDVTINFIPVHGSVAYNKNDVVTHSFSNQKYKISQLQFYANYLKLKNDNGEWVDVSTYFLYNMESNITSLTANIEADVYTQLQFTLGIDSVVNHGDVNAYDINHPLGANSQMNWSQALGYLFYKLEGVADTTIGGGAAPNRNIKYDIGLDNLKQTVYKNINTSLAGGGAATIDIYINTDRLFYDGTNMINFATQNLTHSTGSGFSLAQQMRNNLIAALTN